MAKEIKFSEESRRSLLRGVGPHVAPSSMWLLLWALKCLLIRLRMLCLSLHDHERGSGNNLGLTEG